MTGAHKFNFRAMLFVLITTRQCVVGGVHNCISTGQISHAPSSQQTWLQGDGTPSTSPQVLARLSRLQRLFICLGVRREAFRHHRFFLAIDGTFTKEITRPWPPGQLRRGSRRVSCSISTLQSRKSINHDRDKGPRAADDELSDSSTYSVTVVSVLLLQKKSFKLVWVNLDYLRGQSAWWLGP